MISAKGLTFKYAQMFILYYNICSYIVATDVYTSVVYTQYTSFECGCLEYPAKTLGGGK